MSHDDRDYRRGFHQAVCGMVETLLNNPDAALRQRLLTYEQKVSEWRYQGNDSLMEDPPLFFS